MVSPGIAAPITHCGAEQLRELMPQSSLGVSADGLSGHAAMDGEPATAGRAEADYRRGRLGPRDRRHYPPCAREKGASARVRENQGLRGRPLHQAVRQWPWRALAARARAWLS